MNIKISSDLTKLNSANEIFEVLLKNRGLRSKAQVASFLHPPAPTLSYLLQQTSLKKTSLNQAKKTILSALKNNHDILVFGDYDADGITATAILWQTLVLLAQNSRSRILPFIPDRVSHGYGLSLRAVADIETGKAFKHTLYPDFHPALIITVDNGIVANEAVKKVKDMGVQVIISDHHQPSSELPGADVIVHSSDTSGAGIAWVLALYLTNSHAQIVSMLDIASIGIIADQMKLVGVNRSLVVEGLRALTRSKNLGLQALKQVAGKSDQPITTYDVNFALAPRINAMGRVDDPVQALRLLCTHSPQVATRIAKLMNEHNARRQALTDAAVLTALSSPVRHKLIVVSSRDFHEGVIGLVAGKLAEKHGIPAIAISVGEDLSKGSARSVEGVNITTLLRSSKLLLSVGGHEQAGGFSLKTADIPAFTKQITRYADSHIDDSLLVRSLHVDAELILKQATLTLAKLILTLEPFGLGNYKPRFVAKNLRILENRKIGRDGSHRKLVVEQNGVSRNVIWFNGDLPSNTSHLQELVFTIEVNTWADQESVQLNAQYVVAN